MLIEIRSPIKAVTSIPGMGKLSKCKCVETFPYHLKNGHHSQMFLFLKICYFDND